ncbi:MAG: hypothetical protein JJU26_03135 [Oceanicaulis sp.]|uniref:hypothetical protein n=1 Tax=Glycocaulis sp. TaxID=1969725 RepID=UPI0025B90318|nr:hypothetical protein [Glycocaulis sp.]MCC5980694.1 hypothetical protein [Oceanicaulis sp.]MCH8522246.1 hypothetical protein [Glycocaulis sp.]
MLITSIDRLEPRGGEHAHTLKILLPASRKPGQDEALSEHIDSFVRLYLSRFENRTLRASRIGPLRWAIVSGAQSMTTLEQVRAELETALFGSRPGEESGQVALVGRPVEDQGGEYVTALSETPAEADAGEDWIAARQEVEPESMPESPAAGTAAPQGEGLQGELDAFRADMHAIAQSVKGPPVSEALADFRKALDALSERLESRLADAADKVDSAAERIDTATLRLPDPDRLELALTRNDASAALVTNGLQESLKLLLKAVEGLERQAAQTGAAPHREAA